MKHGQLRSQMVNPFQILGIKPRLVLSDEDLRGVLREAGKQAHPDAGGENGAFVAVREAFAVVSSPSQRLRAWLEWRGSPGEFRGSIDDALMDLFVELAAVTQKAEAVIRQRDESKSALGRALLEGDTQICRETVEAAIAKVESVIGGECAAFADFENAQPLEIAVASQVARNLAFLEKWRLGLRACFSRLV